MLLNNEVLSLHFRTTLIDQVNKLQMSPENMLQGNHGKKTLTK